MATIKSELDYIQEARSQLAEALITKFGVRRYDNAKDNPTLKGLWTVKEDGSADKLKRLHDWALLVTGTNVHTDASLTFKNDGNGDAAGTTFNGSVARSISYNSIGAAASNHVHKNLIIKWGAGDTEGTNLFTYNGSTAKTINLSAPFSQLFTSFGNVDTGFKATNITATISGVTKSFAVNWAIYAGRSQTADKWTTARTLTIGNTGKSIDGSANVSWSLAEIGVSAAAHTHSVKINGTTKTIAASGGAAVNLGNYLPLSGGTMSLGEGLKFHSDENYFGTNLDARIISLLDGNDTTCDGGLIIDERATSNGIEHITELLRIRDSEFKWRGQNILHAGNFNSYSPKLDGTGATGTWNININGSATNSTNVYIEGASSNIDYAILFTTATANSNGRIYADNQWRTAGITFNPSSNTLKVGSRIISPQANYIQTSMRHLDAGLNSVHTDHNLYIGYGQQTYTTVTRFYYSTGTTDSTSSRTEFMQINSNGAYALTRFGVNGQNTSYNLYINGTTYGTSYVNANNFISRVATGTQPYACTSTTLNTNLNADLLDGLHSSDFLRYIITNYGNSINSSDKIGTNLTAGIHRIHISNVEYSSILTGYDFHGSYWQLYFHPTSGYTQDIKYRATNCANWKTLLDSNNYTTYTVKKDGTGASGTWDISITGNADTVDGYHANSFIHFEVVSGYCAARFLTQALANKAASTYIEWWQSNAGWFNFKLGNLNAIGNITGVHFYESSDIRQKTNFSKLIISTKELSIIPLFDFSWKEDLSSRNTGTSAQAVQSILPNLVTESGDYLKLDYGVLGTIAGITACKELVNQKSEIDLLKERIKELEQQLKMINDYGRC